MVRVGPVPAVTVAVTPTAPNSVWVEVPLSCEVTAIEVAPSATRFATVICGLAIVTLTVPAPAVWPLSVYQPLTDPKLALKSPTAIQPEAALIVSVGDESGRTCLTLRLPGVIVFEIVPVWPINEANVDSMVARKSLTDDA